jgi:hypothetical protein
MQIASEQRRSLLEWRQESDQSIWFERYAALFDCHSLAGLYTALSMDFLYLPGNVFYFIAYFYSKEALQKQHNIMFEKKNTATDQPYHQGMTVKEKNKG